MAISGAGTHMPKAVVKQTQNVLTFLNQRLLVHELWVYSSGMHGAAFNLSPGGFVKPKLIGW